MADEMTTTERPNETKRKARKPREAAKRGADVIHVAFGPKAGERGRITDGATGVPASSPATSAETGGANEPVSDVFSGREVAKLLGFTAARLRSLDRAEIVSPSGERKGRRCYTFQDLIALRATRDLLLHRVKIREVALAIGALRRSLPKVTRPLQELRIVSDGRKVVVRAEGAVFEPLTGQMVLDFQVNALREDVVRLLRPETLRARTRTAYDLYTKASGLDEEPATFDEAEALYKRAIELDPALAIAYTNLGNIRFRRGDEAGAVVLYHRALEVDAKQPEAHYNLGYVLLERGEAAQAIGLFEKAIAADPRFADAHFNLAMACEATGLRPKARIHWKRYLELEPTGTWADIAREHL